MQNENNQASAPVAPRNMPEPINSPKQPLVTTKRVGLVVVGTLLFALGLFVGQGRISLTGQPQSTTSTVSSKIDYSQLDELYKTLQQNYDGTVSNQKILDGLKHGMAASSGDPYTEFMTAEEAKEFSGSLQGTISGIGAKLELDDDKNVIIAAPLVGSPAEAAGLRAKDIIVTIDGDSAYGLGVSEAVKKIRGEKGTKVKLSIVRNKSEQLEFTITRDTIKIPSVVTKTVGDGKIGYIQVSQFSGDTDELTEKAADSFKSDGITKIILDLRDNPGGEVTTAINLSSLWLDYGDKIVEQRRGKKVIDTRTATSLNTLKGLPTVVLLNAGSASASEITGLALRENGAAIIMGEKSYGKGVVQQLFPFSDGSSLKVTVAKWYSPKGTNVDKKGVTPDVEVKMTEEAYQGGTDPQLDAAVTYLQKQ